MRAWILALCAALAVMTAQAQATPTSAAGWRQATLADIDALATALRDNTPIPFDRANPSYAQWLDQGAAAARARATQVSDAAGHLATLAAFANGFRDPHIQVRPIGEPAPAGWPGFVAAAAGDGAVVVSRGDADPNDPPLGARIISCDGVSLNALLDARVFPFAFNPALAVDQRRAIGRLFLDRGNPFAPPPLSCVMEVQGQTRTVPLRWRPVPAGDSFWRAFHAATAGPAAAWGLSYPAAGVAWIGAPTFESGPAAEQLAALVKEVEAAGQAIRQGKAIVFDVRGNSGGNSAWAVKIARAALGEAAFGRALPRSGGEAVDWRASADNAAYWRDIAVQAGKEFGPSSSNAAWADHVASQLDKFKGSAPPIWREGAARVKPGGGLTRRRPSGKSPFPATVYLLSNGSCGSSCLNFADIVLHVPGAKLIGSATAADGAYMEIRGVTLPSGLASVSVPQKVYRGAPRAPMEAYAPDIVYHGLWDDALVRAWVLNGIAGEAR